MSSEFFYNSIAQVQGGGGRLLEGPLFDPNFLNLEYFFNLIFRIFDILAALLALLSGFEPGDSPFLRNLFWVLVLALLAAILYAAYRHRVAHKAEEERFEEIYFGALEALGNEERNVRWQKVLTYLLSPNESDWRLAIMEADNILGEMLLRMQLPGESIGEKLKGVEPSDFLTLNDAWEAHKVRNQIAHEGANFQLNRRETERVIALFRKVFEEFHYI